MVPSRPNSQNKYPDQYMNNTSFDETYGVNAVELVAEDSANNVLRRVQVGSDGTLSIGQLVGVAYDYIGVTYPTTSSEVYTYKTGGSGGTTVATITVVYTDTTKEFVSSVTKA